MTNARVYCLRCAFFYLCWIRCLLVIMCFLKWVAFFFFFLHSYTFDRRHQTSSKYEYQSRKRYQKELGKRILYFSFCFSLDHYHDVPLCVCICSDDVHILPAEHKNVIRRMYHIFKWSQKGEKERSTIVTHVFLWGGEDERGIISEFESDLMAWEKRKNKKEKKPNSFLQTFIENSYSCVKKIRRRPEWLVSTKKGERPWRQREHHQQNTREFKLRKECQVIGSDIEIINNNEKKEEEKLIMMTVIKIMVRSKRTRRETSFSSDSLLFFLERIFLYNTSSFLDLLLHLLLNGSLPVDSFSLLSVIRLTWGCMHSTRVFPWQPRLSFGTFFPFRQWNKVLHPLPS